MLAHEVLYWLLVVIGSLLVGRLISVVCPLLVRHMEREWQFEMQVDQEGGLLAQAPSLFSTLWLNRECVRHLVPLRSQRLTHLPYELLSLLATSVVVWHMGFNPPAMAAVLITWSLIALIHIDWNHFLLPDLLVYPLLWSGLLWRAYGHGEVVDGVLGAFFGYAVLWCIVGGYSSLRGLKMMGNGDFKLTAALGAWLGWQALPVMCLVACAAGLMITLLLAKTPRSSLNKPVPFGPALALSGWFFLITNFPV